MEVHTIHEEARRRAKLAGLPADKIQPILAAELALRPIQVKYESLPSTRIADITFVQTDPDFYATLVTFNLSHEFVRDVMLGENTTPMQRSAVEVCLMIVLGADPANARDPEKRRFYQTVMHDISERIGHGIRVMLEPGADGFNMLGEDPHAEHDEP